MQNTIRDIQKALNLPDFDAEVAHKKMAPTFRQNFRPPNRGGQPRLGGVLILLYPYDGEVYLLLTRRRDDLPAHAGQISFPGGRHEDSETFEMTALREAYEEVGIRPSTLTVLGQLTPLYILPSDFEVHPFVAWYHNGRRPSFRSNPAEVAELIEVPLRHFFDPAVRAEEPKTVRGFELMTPYFDVQGHKVWGATAMMLSEFVERLRAIGYGRPFPGRPFPERPFSATIE